MEIRDYVIQNMNQIPGHDIDHFDRVFANGMKLATCEGANSKVVKAFSYLHDSCRLTEGYDPNHGVRAAKLIDKIRSSVLSDYSDEEIADLKTACKLHTNTIMLDNTTINCCFDADRLDLIRYNVVLDPDRMATDTGRYIAQTYNSHISESSGEYVTLYRGGVTDQEINQERISSMWTVHKFYAEHIHNARLTQDILDGTIQRRRIISVNVPKEKVYHSKMQLTKHDLIIKDGVNSTYCTIIAEDDKPSEITLPPESYLLLKYIVLFIRKFGNKEFFKAHIKYCDFLKQINA